MSHRLALSLCAAGLLLATGAANAEADDLPAMALAPPRPALLAASPCTDPGEDAELGLIEAVDLALCRNPQTREAWANARARAAEVGIADGAALPGVNASLGVARDWRSGRAAAQNTRSGSLSLSWLLADFGGRSASRDSARQLLAAAAASQDSTTQAVFLAAVRAFYEAQSTDAAQQAARESERASAVALEAAEARVRVGSGTPADRLQAKTARSQATLNRIRAEGDARNARGTLAAVIGRDAQRPVRLSPATVAQPAADFRADLDALVAEARRQRPDLRAAEAQLRAAESGITAARSAGLPSLSLAASADRQTIDSGPASHGGSIGVTLNVPLFSGFATQYRIRAAQETAEARAEALERLRLQVALDVWTAYQNLVTATQALASSADLMASAEQSARVALGRYQAGVGTLPDLVTAQGALAGARQQRIAAELGWNVSRASLAQAMGRLDLDLLQNLSAASPMTKD